MEVYLSSFKRAKELPFGTEIWSAAVYQPKGFSFPKAAWTDIRGEDGKWIRPREFLYEQDPLMAYRKALYDLYMSRGGEAREWAFSGPSAKALLCWCPYDRAAQRQLDEWGSFVCHTSVLGEFLYNELGVPVWEDADRRQMAVLTQLGL